MGASFGITLGGYCTVTAFGALRILPGVPSACNLHGMHPGVVGCKVDKFLFLKHMSFRNRLVVKHWAEAPISPLAVLCLRKSIRV